MVERETFGSAVEMGVEALKLLGVHSYKAHRAARTFKEHDSEQALREMADVMGDETVLVARSLQLVRDIEPTGT